MRHNNTDSPRATERRQTLQRALARDIKRHAAGLWVALPRAVRETRGNYRGANGHA